MSGTYYLFDEVSSENQWKSGLEDIDLNSMKREPTTLPNPQIKNYDSLKQNSRSTAQSNESSRSKSTSIDSFQKNPSSDRHFLGPPKVWDACERPKQPAYLDENFWDDHADPEYLIRAEQNVSFEDEENPGSCLLPSDTLVEKKPKIVGPTIEIFCLFVCLVFAGFVFSTFFDADPPWDPAYVSKLLLIAVGCLFCVDTLIRLVIHILTGQLCHGAFLINTLCHHVFTNIAIVCCILIDNKDVYRLSYFMMAVEINTLFLRIRRLVKRSTCRYHCVNGLFLITWFAFRIIMWPIMLGYGFKVWWDRGHTPDLYILALVALLGLFLLYIVWTINLTTKQNNNRLREAVIAELDDPQFVKRRPSLGSIGHNFKFRKFSGSST